MPRNRRVRLTTGLPPNTSEARFRTLESLRKSKGRDKQKLKRSREPIQLTFGKDREKARRANKIIYDIRDAFSEFGYVSVKPDSACVVKEVDTHFTLQVNMPSIQNISSKSIQKLTTTMYGKYVPDVGIDSHYSRHVHEEITFGLSFIYKTYPVRQEFMRLLENEMFKRLNKD